MRTHWRGIRLIVAAGCAVLLSLVPGCGGDGDTGAPTWLVDETRAPAIDYPPSFTPGVLKTNLIRYTYYSRITYNFRASTFLEQGEFDVTDYYRGFAPDEEEGVVVPSAMSSGHYRLIGDFSITGRLAAGQAIIEQGTINFYIDRTPADGSRDKDVLIGTARHLFSGGAGSADDPDAIGGFDAVYDDFALTAEGADYWNAPRPFYSDLDFFGNVLTAELAAETLDSKLFDTTGAGGAYFPPSK